MTPVTTNNGQLITVSWVAPVDNGSAISSYLITLRQSDDLTFTEDIVSCDGTQSDIVSQAQCDVPLATLTSAPYSLVYGESVFARVIAINVKGNSVESLEGNGAKVITKPDAPINLLEDTSLRTASTLGLQWQDGASDGGSVILDYRISYAIQG